MCAHTHTHLLQTLHVFPYQNWTRIEREGVSFLFLVQGRTTPLVSSGPGPRGFPNAWAPILSCIKVYYILDYLLPHLVWREGARSLCLLVYCKAGPVTYSTVPSGSHNSTDRLSQFYKPEMPGGNKEYSLVRWEQKPTFQAILNKVSIHKEGGTGRRGHLINRLLYHHLWWTNEAEGLAPESSSLLVYRLRWWLLSWLPENRRTSIAFAFHMDTTPLPRLWL